MCASLAPQLFDGCRSSSAKILYPVNMNIDALKFGVLEIVPQNGNFLKSVLGDFDLFRLRVGGKKGRTVT